MKNSIVSIFLILVVICGCKKQQTNYLAIMQSHTWKLVGYMNANGSVIISDPIPDSPAWYNHLTLAFKNDTTFYAQMLVNEQFGKVSVNNSSNAINFILGGSSAVNDTFSWDSLFLATLPIVSSYSVNNDNLKLTYSNGKYMYFVNDSI